MIQRYFEDEMHYLHEAGKEFAKIHPDQGRFLNIDSISDRDPYVERLFEGFAFLVARIRERLDDELPEYTEGLFNLLWPHFLRPIPSLAILEFRPNPGEMPESYRLEKGAEVQSQAVGDNATRCRFRTTSDLWLHPISLEEVTLNWPADSTSFVKLRFMINGLAGYQGLNLNPLRLYFHADSAIASIMHLYFTRYVTKVNVRSGGDENVNLPGQQWIQPGGMAADEGLLPYSRQSFTGFRRLQEYLNFRQKFFCVDIYGLDHFKPASTIYEFEVDVHFSKAYPEDKQFKTGNVRLHCVPAVNIFKNTGEPIRVDHAASDYRVVPDAGDPANIKLYDIESIASVEESTGKTHEYQPFFSFRHPKQSQRFFVDTIRTNPSNGFDTYISLGGFDLKKEKLPIETLSLELNCTNGNLPREKLQENMVTIPGANFPGSAQCTNITRPTLELRPPLQKKREFFWRLISHLSLNYLSVATPEALIGALELYDWTDSDANKRRIAGITKVTWKPKERIHRGAIIRGAEVIITVKDGHFSDEGDLHLFGQILNDFFSMYATINSFIHLTLISTPSGREFKWQNKNGQRPLI